MPSIPIPMIGALVLGFLFAALVLRRDRHWLVSVLVGACALQSLIISLGQHYGVDSFRAVQPVTAASIPPLAWLAFRRFRIERACERLLAGESVAIAMDSSGFSTRSNFNREFRRVTGRSPSEWRVGATRG